MKRNQSMRRKLISAILLTSGAVLVLACTCFITYEVLTFRKSTIRYLSTLGEMIASNCTGALAFDSQRDAEEILSALEAEPHLMAARLYDAGGRPFASYSREDASAVLAEPGPDGFRFLDSHLVGFLPVSQDGNRLGTIGLQYSTSVIVSRLTLYAGIVLLVVVASLFLSYGLSRVFEKAVREPVLSLAETARTVSEEGNYSIRAVRRGDGELGYLTEAFNGMLGRIEDQDREIRSLNASLELRVAERTAELEAVNMELEAFSYSVSHDLRAPLRHIDGFSKLLEREVADELSDSGRRYLGVISDAARKMGTLIDDLLSFSRMGRAECSREPVDMNVLVSEVVQEVTGLVPDRRIVWDIEPLPEARVDRAMFRQVWTNLLSNAVKYTGRREEAVIRICSGTDDHGDTVISVIDNGAGFNMEYADKLFGVFQRLHRSDEFEGTGIGLANVRRIINRHGGSIWAEAEVDRGATFTFSLPAAA